MRLPRHLSMSHDRERLTIHLWHPGFWLGVLWEIASESRVTATWRGRSARVPTVLVWLWALTALARGRLGASP